MTFAVVCKPAYMAEIPAHDLAIPRASPKAPFRDRVLQTPDMKPKTAPMIAPLIKLDVVATKTWTARSAGDIIETGVGENCGYAEVGDGAALPPDGAAWASSGETNASLRDNGQSEDWHSAERLVRYMMDDLVRQQVRKKYSQAGSSCRERVRLDKECARNKGFEGN